MAIVEAVAAFAFDAQRRSESNATLGLAKLKQAADSWNESGRTDRTELSERLRHAWTDFVLSDRGRR